MLPESEVLGGLQSPPASPYSNFKRTGSKLYAFEMDSDDDEEKTKDVEGDAAGVEAPTSAAPDAVWMHDRHSVNPIVQPSHGESHHPASSCFLALESMHFYGFNDCQLHQSLPVHPRGASINDTT